MTKHFNAAFAMSFTHEEVVLEKREPEGWRRLGSVRFTRGDLGQQLSTMRVGDAPGQAVGDPASPDTLLVIPDDQILYTILTVPAGPEPGLAVARALEGLTPYEVRDLAFDWAPAGGDQADSLRIAAVARRTLQEAEDFALSQGFRPTGFIARPGDDRFPGQPDFGPSATVRELTRRGSVSGPELRRAGVTSAGIADLPGEPAPSAPAISRIVAHVYPAIAPAPAAKPTRAVAVVSEFTPAPARGPNAAPAPRDLRAGPANPVEGPVIRHPAPPVRPAGPDKALPVRAQAVHSRAAEARARREADKAATPAAGRMAALIGAARALNHRLPSTFAVMMGLLVVALVAVLLFFGGNPAPEVERIAATAPVVDEAEASVETDPSDAPVETAPAAEDVAVFEDTTEPLDPAELAAEPDLPEPVPAAPVEMAAEPVTEATEPQAIAETETAAPEAVATGDPATPAGDDSLAAADSATAPAATTEAAREAAVRAALAEAQAEAPAPTPPAAPQTAAPAAAPAPAPASPRTVAATQPAPLRTLALTRSTRPAPPPSRTAAPVANDAAPLVPLNPRPFAERAQPAPSRVTGIRPPSRPAANRQAAATPAAATAPAPTPAAQRPADSLQRSIRPPARPDRQSMMLLLPAIGDAPRQAAASPVEIEYAKDLLRNLRTAELGKGSLSRAERGAVILLAEARPQRRPVDVRGGTQRAVDKAVAAAMSESPPPARKPQSEPPRTAASPIATGGLSRSTRPLLRPAALAGRAGGSRVSGESVEKAIAAAVASGPLAPGAKALTQLSSSPLPPRRSGGRGGMALAAPAAAAQQVAAATPAPGAAEAA
ncbi:MAG: hypothetical protein ACK5IP_07485, partial [Paracoccus sp. (in: a-proteobacteria)]